MRTANKIMITAVAAATSFLAPQALAQSGTDTFDTDEMSQSGGFYFG